MSFSILCCPLHSSLVVARLGVETLEGASKINLVKMFEKKCLKSLVSTAHNTEVITYDEGSQAAQF